MPRNSKNSLTIYASDELKEMLKQVSHKTNRPIAWLMREAAIYAIVEGRMPLFNRYGELVNPPKSE